MNYAEFHDLLQKVKSFSISTYDQWKIKNKNDGEILACNEFVKPLIKIAKSARLYPAKNADDFIRNNGPALIRDKNVYEFNLSVESVEGYHEFWCAGARNGLFQRGTIVVVIKDLEASIFKNTVLYGVMGSRYQIEKGSSKAAIDYSIKMAENGYRCCMFSASNGIESVDIFSPLNYIEEDYLMVQNISNKPGWILT